MPNKSMAMPMSDQDCAICHCEMILPTAIPACGHKFCFICLKGVNMSHLGGCPICRGPIDTSIFKKPSQDLDLKMDIPDAQAPTTSNPAVKEVKQEVDEDIKPDVAALNAQMNNPQPAKMFWLYHGRQQGWWRFEPRVEKDIEEAFASNMPVTEVTICGKPYVVDFTKMSQYPKNHRASARDVKRVDTNEFDALNVKGLAGVVPSS